MLKKDYGVFGRALAVCALVCAALSLTGCGYETVPAGNVGVKVHLYGNDKGVQAEELPVGRYWYNPWYSIIFTFPTFTQTRTWTEHNGEAMNFNSNEGMQITGEIGMTYHIDPAKVTTLFQKYRKGIDEITDLYIHNNVRDELNKTASTYPIEDIYGTKKAELLAKVQDAVTADVQKDGLIIERIYWVSSPILPQNVITSINNKIQATQQAELRQNEVAMAEAEARKEVAVAQGHAQATIADAQAKAKAIQLEGDALKDNPGLTQMRAVEKWDGKLPIISGGGNNLISLPAGMLSK